jgi:hypothetical protein
MTEDLNDQFASLSVQENLSADPRVQVSSSSRPPSPSAASDASSTGSEGTAGPSSPSNIISSGNEGRFESPPPRGTPPPPSSITALQELSPLSAPPQIANNDLSNPSGATPSADNSRRTIRISKAQGNAKQELQIYFDRHDKHPVQLPKKVFVAWDDGNEPHVKRFTCIFVSPARELFPSGKLWDARGHSYESISNIHWYKTKKEAIEAAAARAIDCLNYRDRYLPQTDGDERFQFGKEDPYDSEDPQSPPQDLPRKIPDQTKQAIRDLGGTI